MISEEDKLLVDWQHSKNKLKEAQATEFELRQRVIKTFFPAINLDDTRNEGTHNFMLGKDFRLKLEARFNYKLEAADKLMPILDKLAATAGPDLCKTLVKWSPNLVLATYRNLPTNCKKIIDRGLTIRPATPSIEIMEPK